MPNSFTLFQTCFADFIGALDRERFIAPISIKLAGKVNDPAARLQGFRASTKMKLAGKVSDPLARLIVTPYLREVGAGFRDSQFRDFVKRRVSTSL